MLKVVLICPAGIVTRPLLNSKSLPAVARGSTLAEAADTADRERNQPAAEVRAWDIDVNAEGVGLPAGSGGYRRGATVYAAQCAVCHGPKGEGVPPNPRLIGTDPRDFSFGTDPKLVKTIG